jgi:uncharacterized repeat protein (TIGR03803 family)
MQLSSARLRKPLLSITISLLLSTAAMASSPSESVPYNFTTASTTPYLSADSAGNLYGTTESGTASPYGAIFELSPNGNGGWTETTLFTFDGKNGNTPSSTLVLDSAGNIYGTTVEGGDGSCKSPTGQVIGCGVAFELSPPAAGSTWKYTILYDFKGGFDAEYPGNNLVLRDGELYGSSEIGDTTDGNYGTVYRLTPPGQGGTKWTETVLFTFNGSDGEGPAWITFHDGSIWGTAGGGTSGDGIVFELTPISGHWVENVAYSFAGGTDGSGPVAIYFGKSPYPGYADFMYGVTCCGGEPGAVGKPWGVVFSLGYNIELEYWQYSVLYDFLGESDGGTPNSLIESNGNLYGTTVAGGNTADCSNAVPFDGCGVVFEFSPATGTESVVYAFTGPPTDGLVPDSLTWGGEGILYGATEFGGNGACSNNQGQDGCGTVFEIKQ